MVDRARLDLMALSANLVGLEPQSECMSIRQQSNASLQLFKMIQILSGEKLYRSLWLSMVKTSMKITVKLILHSSELDLLWSSGLTL